MFQLIFYANREKQKKKLHNLYTKKHQRLIDADKLFKWSQVLALHCRLIGRQYNKSFWVLIFFVHHCSSVHAFDATLSGIIAFQYRSFGDQTLNGNEKILRNSFCMGINFHLSNYSIEFRNISLISYTSLP